MDVEMYEATALGGSLADEEQYVSSLHPMLIDHVCTNSKQLTSSNIWF